MRSGTLRLICRIEIADPVRGDDGSFTPSFSVLYEGVPMSIVPLSGREYTAAGAERAGITARGEMLYPDDLADPTILHRGRVVMEDGRMYGIEQALPDPTHRRSLSLMLTDTRDDGA